MNALSILFIAIGAILAFAVNVVTDSVDLFAIGVILMIVGGIGLFVGLLRGSWGFRTERHVSSDGRHVVEETRETI